MATDSIGRILRHNLPCAVTLPAGCGKTHAIAEMARIIADEGNRTLVLTHTHAGVDALKRRFRQMGVPSRAATIRTLDSWCFDLIRRYPQLSGIVVGEEPDWKQSSAYHAAGAKASDTAVVQRMLKVSYEVVIVDEYQDCQVGQHELVKWIAAQVPTCVLGDPLQGLFFFDKTSASVIWENDVVTHFPEVQVPVKPWRWREKNESLGEWLLEARDALLNGGELDLTAAPLTYCQLANLDKICKEQPKHPERVVAIAKWPSDCARLAARLAGNYSMIEEIEGRHLLGFASTVDSGDPSLVASAVREFAVSCAYGVATEIDAYAGRKLAQGKSLNVARYPHCLAQVESLYKLLIDCSLSNIKNSLQVLSKLPSFRLYRREAWRGILDALDLASVSSGLSVRDAVVKTRNHLRVVGRYPESRIIARPLLIKGLEFDHAVVTDPDKYNAHELYVCLTRGASSLTVVSPMPKLSPARPY